VVGETEDIMQVYTRVNIDLDGSDCRAHNLLSCAAAEWSLARLKT